MAPPSPPEADAEAALAAHWSQLGRLEGSELHEEDGITWFETPVRHLPRRRRPADAGGGPRGSGPGLAPGDEPPPAPGVEVRPAVDEADTAAYTALTVRYWEVPDEEVASVGELHRGILPDRFPGQRFLALVDGEPVGKAYLSWPGPPGVASVYGMSVQPSARGRGVAGALTAVMLADARERGMERVVLHATDMAVGVYARAGFRACGGADVYATTALWTEA